jgi:hypothetical protein
LFVTKGLINSGSRYDGCIGWPDALGKLRPREGSGRDDMGRVDTGARSEARPGRSVDLGVPVACCA